jgi:MFS family permease
MTAIPVKPRPGDGVLKATAYFIVFLLAVPVWVSNTNSLSALRTFGIPSRDVETLWFTTILGYVVASLVVGWLFSRMGAGTILLVGSIFAGLGMLGYALAPTWGWVIAWGLFDGAGRAVLFVGLVIYFAARYGERALAWLFVFHGLSLIINVILPAGTFLAEFINWRTGFMIAVVTYGVVTILFAATRRLWNLLGQDDDFPPTVYLKDILRLPPVWLVIGMFTIQGILASATVMNMPILVGEIGSAVGFDILKFWSWLNIIGSAISVAFLGLYAYRRNTSLAILLCLIGSYAR